MNTARYATLEGRVGKTLGEACSTDIASTKPNSAWMRKDGLFEATNGHLLIRVRPVLTDSEGQHTDELPEDLTRWYIWRNTLTGLRVSQGIRLDLETGHIDIIDKYGPAFAAPGASTRSDPGKPLETDRIYNSAMANRGSIRFRLAPELLEHLAKIAKAYKEEGVTLNLSMNLEEQLSKGSPPDPILFKVGDAEGVVMPMTFGA